MSEKEAGSVNPSGAAAEEQGRALTAEDAGEQPPVTGIDTSKPHVARMYDYYLGGKNNYPADREAAEQILRMMPPVRIAARANRRFLVESVRWLVREAGVRQFLDIGSGLPTQQNVHEVAQAIDKDARVVYVDNDPLVRVHAEALLATTPNTIVIEADLRDPRGLLERKELREHIDFSQPVALLLVAVLHFIQDTEQAYEITRTLYEALPSGSYVVLSHAFLDERFKDFEQKGREIYSRSNSGITPRTPEEIAGFFAGLTPIGTGLTHIADWSIGASVRERQAEENDVIRIDDTAVLRKFPGMCGVARIDR